jgi:hypothetical protein
MKKFLVLFVCAAALSAGSAFALDLPDAIKIPGLTVTGQVWTGLRVNGGTYVENEAGGVGEKAKEGDNIATDPKVYAYSDAIDDGTPFRARLTLVWTRDNLGVKTQFQYVPATPDAPEYGPFANGDLGGKLRDLNNTINKAFVYAYLFDKKAKLSLGKGTDPAWTIPWSNIGSGNDDAFDGGLNGVKLEVTPIDSLKVGAAYGTKNLFGKANTQLKDNPEDESQEAQRHNYTDQDDDVRKFIVGAKYTTDNLKVTLALLANIWGLENSDFSRFNYQSNETAFDRKINDPFKGTSNLLIGASFTPIAPLTINFAGAITGLGSKTVAKAWEDTDSNTGDYPENTSYKDGKFNPYWIFMPKLNGEFAVNDALSVGLTISDWYFADEYYTKKSDETEIKDRGQGLLFPITFNPYVAYKLNDNITTQLDLNLKINYNGSDRFGFGLKPSATFDLGSGATFVVYDEITFYGKSKGWDDEDFTNEHMAAAGAALQSEEFFHNSPYGVTTNTLQFDFVWTF